MKIFQIGFNKCGTKSLCKFFSSSGLRCVHWAGGNLALDIFNNHSSGRKLLEGVYEDYDYYGDMEAFLNTTSGVVHFQANLEYVLLDEHYPGSRFILNTRSVDDWVASRVRHYANFPGVIEMAYGSADPVVLWREDWRVHHEGVLDYFSGRDDLLVYEIGRDDSSKIVDFFPDIKFGLARLPRIF